MTYDLWPFKLTFWQSEQYDPAHLVEENGSCLSTLQNPQLWAMGLRRLKCLKRWLPGPSCGLHVLQSSPQCCHVRLPPMLSTCIRQDRNWQKEDQRITALLGIHDLMSLRQHPKRMGPSTCCELRCPHPVEAAYKMSPRREWQHHLDLTLDECLEN